MVALRCIAAARTGFLLAALHSVAKRVSRGQAYHPTRSRPRWPEDRPARLRRHDPQLRSPWPSHRACPLEWNRSQDTGVLVLAEPHKPRDSSPSSGKWGPAALANTRGPCGAGGRAFRGLTRSATEWSAARRKPIRAAVMHIGAAIFEDVKARRLPTSGRRKFPSGNFRSARDFEGAERVNPRNARAPTPALSPFARNRGMSPFQ